MAFTRLDLCCCVLSIYFSSVSTMQVGNTHCNHHQHHNSIQSTQHYLQSPLHLYHLSGLFMIIELNITKKLLLHNRFIRIFISSETSSVFRLLYFLFFVVLFQVAQKEKCTQKLFMLQIFLKYMECQIIQVKPCASFSLAGQLLKYLI